MLDTTSFPWADADRPAGSVTWSSVLTLGSLPLWVPLCHQLGPRQKGGEQGSKGNLVSQEKGHTKPPRLLPRGRDRAHGARVGVPKQMQRIEQDRRSTLYTCVKARGTACCDRDPNGQGPLSLLAFIWIRAQKHTRGRKKDLRLSAQGRGGKNAGTSGEQSRQGASAFLGRNCHLQGRVQGRKGQDR